MYFGVFLLALMREILAQRLGIPAKTWPAEPRLRPLIGFAALCVLPFLFLVQLAVIGFTARHQIAPPCWLHLPVPVVADLGETTGGPGLPFTSFLLVGIAAAQSFTLWLFFSARKEQHYKRYGAIIIGCVSAITLVAALFTPAMTSPDVITYTTYAELGHSSFAKEPHAVALKNFPIENLCERRVLPSAYGPAFIAYLQMFTALSHSVSAQIVMLRIANALWFLLLLCALRTAGAPAIALSLAAVNPVLIFQYVANAHNDLIGAVFTIAGAALVKRSPLAAACAIVTAAQVKLSFAFIGILIFAELASTKRGFAWATGTFVASFIISYIFAGRTYFESIWYYDRLLAPTADPLQYLVVACAIFALVRALLQQRFDRIFIYAFPALRIQTFFPWYAIWSLPYALLEKRYLPAFLILMPIVAVLMESGLAKSAQIFAYFVACAAIGIGMVLDLRAKRRTPISSDA
jgi:hypothetical protein